MRYVSGKGEGHFTQEFQIILEGDVQQMKTFLYKNQSTDQRSSLI